MADGVRGDDVDERFAAGERVVRAGVVRRPRVPHAADHRVQVGPLGELRQMFGDQQAGRLRPERARTRRGYSAGASGLGSNVSRCDWPAELEEHDDALRGRLPRFRCRSARRMAGSESPVSPDRARCGGATGALTAGCVESPGRREDHQTRRASRRWSEGAGGWKADPIMPHGMRGCKRVPKLVAIHRGIGDNQSPRPPTTPTLPACASISLPLHSS